MPGAAIVMRDRTTCDMPLTAAYCWTEQLSFHWLKIAHSYQYTAVLNIRNTKWHKAHTHTHNHFTALWTKSGTTRVSRYQKVHFAIFGIFWSKMKITQTDIPTNWMNFHPIQTNWCPHLCHPHHFYAQSNKCWNSVICKFNISLIYYSSQNRQRQDVYHVKVNPHAKWLGQRSFHLKVTVLIDTHTSTSVLHSTWTTKVIGKKADISMLRNKRKSYAFLFPWEKNG